MRYLFGGIVLVVYGLLNYFIGIRGLRSINLITPVIRVFYWIALFSFALMYIVGMLGKDYLPQVLTRIFSVIGGYWMAASMYLLGFILIIDIFRLIARKLGAEPSIFINKPWILAVAAVVIVAILLTIGTYNAFIPRTTTYNVSVNKKAGNKKQLKCAMISDVHLGDAVGRKRLHKAVEVINSLEADIVVFTGDLIDIDIRPVEKEHMLDELKGIKSKYGVYAILGNHEYYGKTVDRITELIQNSGVKVLKDEYVLIENSFYLVGREDTNCTINGYNRKNLASILSGVDKSLPVILLDHQPINLDEPRKEVIDLQLSGHTHAGQLFPINLITSAMFEEDNGYLKDDNFNLIVSCGYGTWGPAIRLGSQSEVVNINLNFAQ